MTIKSNAGLLALRSLCVLAAALGSLIPGLSSLVALAPPYLRQPAVISAVLVALVAVVLVWPTPGRSTKELRKRRLVRGVAGVLGGLLLALLYLAILPLTTVAPPPVFLAETCQTGFGLQFLNDDIRQFAASHAALANPQGLMMAVGGFPGCHTELVWQQWSISAAGLALMILFMAAAGMWTLGFAQLSRALPRDLVVAKPQRVAVLFLVACWTTSCLGPPATLRSSHASYEERIKLLDAKVKELRNRPPAGRR
jgi:hypothetical protein